MNCLVSTSSLSLSLSLLVPGFVVFVGLVLPGAMVAMWMFWECCYEVDEEDEEDNRLVTPTNPSPSLNFHHSHIITHTHTHTHTHTINIYNGRKLLFHSISAGICPGKLW